MIPQLTITDSFISSASAATPLTLAYARQHIRALGSADDALTIIRINAAAQYFEEQTGRQLLTTTREAWLDAFPFIGASGANARIELPKPPLRSVVSVKYIDSSGVLQSFRGGSPLADLFRTSAPVGTFAARGCVEPLYGGTWPTARAETGAVRIQYTCGYGSSMDDIPELIRGVLCFLIGHFDTFPSATSDGSISELPLGPKQLMEGFKYTALPSQVLREYAQHPYASYDTGSV